MIRILKIAYSPTFVLRFAELLAIAGVLVSLIALSLYFVSVSESSLQGDSIVEGSLERGMRDKFTVTSSELSGDKLRGFVEGELNSNARKKLDGIAQLEFVYRPQDKGGIGLGPGKSLFLERKGDSLPGQAIAKFHAVDTFDFGSRLENELPFPLSRYSTHFVFLDLRIHPQSLHVEKFDGDMVVQLRLPKKYKISNKIYRQVPASTPNGFAYLFSAEVAFQHWYSFSILAYVIWFWLLVLFAFAQRFHFGIELIAALVYVATIRTFVIGIDGLFLVDFLVAVPFSILLLKRTFEIGGKREELSASQNAPSLIGMAPHHPDQAKLDVEKRSNSKRKTSRKTRRPSPN